MILKNEKRNKFILNSFIFVLIFFYLSHGLNWGLPSNERVAGLFGNKDELLKESDGLAKVYQQERKKKDNKIYIKDYKQYVSSQAYETSISLALSRFLVVPYAGDDSLILKALRNLDPKSYDFDPNFYMYGGGFVYSSAVLLGALDFLNIIKLKNNIVYYLENPSEIGNIYLSLRYLVLFSFLLGFVIFFYFVKKYFGEKHAYLSSLILLINPEIIASTHAIEPHAFVFPIFMLGIIFAQRYYLKSKNKYLVLYAIFSGLSIGTQATSLYILFPFFYIQYLNFRKDVGLKNIIINFLKFLIISLVSFLIINPYYLINFSGMISDLLVGFNNLLSTKETNATIFSEFRAPFQISLFLTVLFIFSVFYYFAFISNKNNNLLIFIIVPAILIYVTLGGIMQYIFSSLAIFSILSSLMIFNLINRINSFQIKFSIIFLVISLMIISPLSRSLYYFVNYGYDNRLISAIWINENIETNKKISLRYPPTNWDSVPFDFRKYIILNKKNSLDADYVLLVNEELNPKFEDQFTLLKKFPPKSVLGYRSSLKGEVHAIYAKYISIYKKK